MTTAIPAIDFSVRISLPCGDGEVKEDVLPVLEIVHDDIWKLVVCRDGMIYVLRNDGRSIYHGLSFDAGMGWRIEEVALHKGKLAVALSNGTLRIFKDQRPHLAGFVLKAELFTEHCSPCVKSLVWSEREDNVLHFKTIPKGRLGSVRKSFWWGWTAQIDK